ncbi:MAG: NAD-dependent deacylase, partial [Planctomycetota bacterium]|nr:NAD-dependent deacylase [Planctomycetota bacterium]
LSGPVLARSRALFASADVVRVVGTSGLVQPAAGLVTVGAEQGASLIEVNPESTPFSGSVDVSLFGAAGEVLPVLLAP